MTANRKTTESEISEPELKAEDVFNPKDFQTIKLNIQFKNFTTKTDVRDDSKNSLLEVGDKQLVLEVPGNACNMRHSIFVAITAKVPGKQTPRKLIDITGQVIAAEPLESGTMRITMKCVQFDDRGWEELLSLYSSRQEQITAFLQSVRGY